MTILKWPTLILSIAVILGGCGSDEDEAETGSTSLTEFDSEGSIVKFTSGATSATISFADSEAGAKYFILPYAVGATSGNNAVQGGSSNTLISFSVATSNSSSLQNLKPSPRLPPKQFHSLRTYDHQMRSFINRFEPGDPKQISKARALDARSSEIRKRLSYLNNSSLVESIRGQGSSFKIPSIRRFSGTKQLTLASSCPSPDDLPGFRAGGLSDTFLDSDQVKLENSGANDGYCLFVDQRLKSSSVTIGSTTSTSIETSIDNIKTNIQNTIAAYKRIYSSQFSAAASIQNSSGEAVSFTFLPMIIYIPRGGDAWPTTQIEVSGAFSSFASREVGGPVLFVKGNMDSAADATEQKELLHSAIDLTIDVNQTSGQKQ